MLSLFDLEDLSSEELQNLTTKSLANLSSEQAKIVVALDLLSRQKLKDSPLSVPEYSDKFLKWYRLSRQEVTVRLNELVEADDIPDNISRLVGIYHLFISISLPKITKETFYFDDSYISYIKNLRYNDLSKLFYSLVQDDKVYAIIIIMKVYIEMSYYKVPQVNISERLTMNSRINGYMLALLMRHALNEGHTEYYNNLGSLAIILNGKIGTTIAYILSFAYTPSFHEKVISMYKLLPKQYYVMIGDVIKQISIVLNKPNQFYEMDIYEFNEIIKNFLRLDVSCIRLLNLSKRRYINMQKEMIFALVMNSQYCKNNQFIAELSEKLKATTELIIGYRG